MQCNEETFILQLLVSHFKSQPRLYVDNQSSRITSIQCHPWAKTPHSTPKVYTLPEYICVFKPALTSLKLNCFQVKAQSDFSDEMFSSKWHYAKHIINRETASGTTKGYHNYDFHQTDDWTRVSQILQLYHFKDNSQ